MRRFRKTFSTADVAKEALRRTEWLRAKGIRTPDARPGATPDALTFDHITGSARFDLIATTPMPALLAPLAALHDLPAISVPRFDPLLRIRPRLRANDPGWLTAALSQHGMDELGGTALLHGDFHVGQLIGDDAGVVWLIDLDDLACGPLEADLGNFIAHLATSPEADRGHFAESLVFWRREVLDGWAALGRGYDRVRVDRFLRLALIRRHLKLRATGRPDYGAAIERSFLAP